MGHLTEDPTIRRTGDLQRQNAAAATLCFLLASLSAAGAFAWAAEWMFIVLTGNPQRRNCPDSLLPFLFRKARVKRAFGHSIFWKLSISVLLGSRAILYTAYYNDRATILEPAFYAIYSHFCWLSWFQNSPKNVKCGSMSS